MSFLETQFWDALDNDEGSPSALLALQDFRPADRKRVGGAVCVSVCVKAPRHRHPEGGACGWGRWNLGGPCAQNWVGKPKMAAST